MMKKLIGILAVLLLAGFSQAGYTAGGPLIENLDELVPVTERAISAGNQGDAESFLKETNDALTQTQSHPDSAKQQRILTRLRKAIKLGEAGKLGPAVKAMEDAKANMK